MLHEEYKDIKEILLKHNIKPTRHKIKVLKFLLENRIHPTVDEIYRGVKDIAPTISRTTIYNIVNSLAKKGLIKLLKLDTSKTRCDIWIKPHAHFKCIICGKIYDIELDETTINKIVNSIDPHFSIQDIDITIEGRCTNCVRGFFNQRE